MTIEESEPDFSDMPSEDIYHPEKKKVILKSPRNFDITNFVQEPMSFADEGKVLN